MFVMRSTIAMRCFRVELSALLAAVLLLVLALPAIAQTAPDTDAGLPLPPPGTQLASTVLNARFACPTVPAVAAARCHALVRTDVTPRATAATPSGYGPADVQNAYNLPVAGAGAWVALIDAYSNPNVVSDLTAYRSTYGLPPLTCQPATATPCLRVVNQQGNTSPLPSGDTGWGLEIALDVDAVSAACPACNILLVEAASNSFADLGAAVNYAATQPGVAAISNSYGAAEFRFETSSEAPYNHPGIAVTVSSGDGGYGVEFPAASRYVTAVGGTTLRRDTSARGWGETVWSGAGSGCSRYIPKPSWQTDAGCGRRTVADVAAVADPNSGLAVYDTYGYGGWLVVGGTSASAPLIAAVYALAGNAASTQYGSYPYSHTSGLFDITSGSNGRCLPKQLYLCTGGSGYDGPTGLGTPNGVSGF
jgi:subtilase family serine protease